MEGGGQSLGNWIPRVLNKVMAITQGQQMLGTNSPSEPGGSWRFHDKVSKASGAGTFKSPEVKQPESRKARVPKHENPAAQLGVVGRRGSPGQRRG